MSDSALITRLRSAGCVFAEDEVRVLLTAARSSEELEAMVARRVAGIPLEHVVGWVEFCGLRVAVEPGVFVPRRRTEFLARQAASLAFPGALVVDLCCGSGAVGAAVADAVDGIEVHATDVDPAAVRCARRNLTRVYRGDLFEPLPTALQGRVNVLVTNTPYVPTDAVALMPPEARDHEPHIALDGGADGLDVQRRVAAEARQWLAQGGSVLVEASEAQAPASAAAFARHGLNTRIALCEESQSTVVIGRAES